jgi:hypothetical protein
MSLPWARWYPRILAANSAVRSPSAGGGGRSRWGLGKGECIWKGEGATLRGAVDCLASQVVYRAKESLANAEPPVKLPYVIALCSHCCTLHQRWWHTGIAHSMAVGTHGST